jgi:uncharacterized protein with von Willebrand factor type A (vWA) domain
VVRGATCVILSDGLEVGDPELLGAQMERLARLAHRVVWLNPLKGSAAYEPLAHGMAAALPHIDVFRAGHNLQSLEEVAEVISARGSAPRAGRARSSGVRSCGGSPPSPAHPAVTPR